MGAIERLKNGVKALGAMGFEKERAALALLSLAFFGVLFILVALGAQEGFARVFVGLAICYVVAFLALASQWFWARWFASGIAWSGLGFGLMLLVMVGWHPFFGLYTGLHALVIMTLLGQKMAARYELQPAWRERYAMDEYGVARLGKAVTRASASLPTLIMWALAPRQDQGMELVPLIALVVAASGLAAMLRLRTWGVMATAAVAVLVGVSATVAPHLGSLAVAGGDIPMSGLWQLMGAPGLAVALAVWAVLPLARPVLLGALKER